MFCWNKKNSEQNSQHKLHIGRELKDSEILIVPLNTRIPIRKWTFIIWLIPSTPSLCPNKQTIESIRDNPNQRPKSLYTVLTELYNNQMSHLFTEIMSKVLQN